MPHSNYKLKDRLVWDRKSKSFLMISKAYWKDIKLDVIKREINHKKPQLRNMIKYCISPWLFIAPQDIVSYFGTSPYGIDNWWNTKDKDKDRCSCTIYGKRQQSVNKIRQLILKHEKEFIYTFNAYISGLNNELTSINRLYNIYKMWKKYPQDCEMLVKLGFNYLATQTSVYRLSKPKKQALIKWLVEHKDIKVYKGFSLNDIQQDMWGIKYPYLFSECYRSIGLYNYVINNGYENLLSTYFDYKNACKELGKNLKDTYWLYPKDLHEAHNKVMVELENYRELAKQKERLDYNKELKLIPKCETTIGGFSLYLANDISDIEEQAKVLKQCLISMKYYEKVAEKESLLVFVKKDNERIGTCEIGYNSNKQIKQFYCDETDRNNREKLYPSQELKDIMNSYLANLKINKNKQIKYIY